jgi:hypothetical protein
MNAAVWFGTAVFFVFAGEPATSSSQMVELIGTNNFPYFSVAIGQILAARFFYVSCACSAVALVHLGVEWLYLGKYPSRPWLGVVAGLCLLGLAQGGIVQPAVRESHNRQFRQRVPVAEREAAARAFRAWRGLSKTLNLVLLAGLGCYLWRMGNPPDPMRFVSARQFRS